MTTTVSPDSAGLRRVDQLLAHYEESHRNPKKRTDSFHRLLEGKKPLFFEDIQYLWVGPLFVLSKLFTNWVCAGDLKCNHWAASGSDWFYRE